MHLTKQEFDALLDKDVKKGNKFKAQKTTYNGQIFDSKKEATRAYELNALLRQKEIASFERQIKFDITINGMKVCTYIADFRVVYPDGHVEIEDVKGYKKGSAYSVFRLKKKLMKATHGIDIIEI